MVNSRSTHTTFMFCLPQYCCTSQFPQMISVAGNQFVCICTSVWDMFNHSLTVFPSFSIPLLLHSPVDRLLRCCHIQSDVISLYLCSSWSKYSGKVTWAHTNDHLPKHLFISDWTLRTRVHDSRVVVFFFVCRKSALQKFINFVTVQNAIFIFDSVLESAT